MAVEEGKFQFQSISSFAPVYSPTHGLGGYEAIQILSSLLELIFCSHTIALHYFPAFLQLYKSFHFSFDLSLRKETHSLNGKGNMHKLAHVKNSGAVMGQAKFSS